MADPAATATPFLERYFTTFDFGSRATLEGFYTSSSRLTFEDTTCTGASEIVPFLFEAPKQLEHKRAKTVVDEIGSGGNLSVLVTGLLEFGKRGTTSKFATSLVLGRKEGGTDGEERWVILSQIISISFDGSEEVDMDD
ncbi:hypothetical protein DOTSEDRAFT_71711 [Dothistroma septosporum NZE10]|uniref:NTF2-related export protein n=1 Tax=Dothistroma septosporum (strain NZE10 / CBS 128990) TaxID=675120 RepID=N1PNN0_DOTSN|nr:hypothetical protein DOTSEDRAFT_71711 [Dothistroma septosporum NZE10]